MTAPADTLLMFSGGLDSTYCLWQRVRRSLSTRTHHVHITDAEGRKDVEAQAVTGILGWMDRNGGRGLIEHTESSIGPGDLGLLEGRPMFGYWTGVILSTPLGRYLRNVVVPQNADDGPAVGDKTHYLEFVRLMARVPNLDYPIRHLTKADIVREMPADLLALCWWCRRPQDGQSCHDCYTCKLVDPALPRPGRRPVPPRTRHAPPRPHRPRPRCPRPTASMGRVMLCN